ncbi:MAG: DUF1232 domain-containing protein [Thermoanaerobaculia bacterium]|nr:DUF1232 domain-containing protein [Thermoanaerobaculia bacterium]
MATKKSSKPKTSRPKKAEPELTESIDSMTEDVDLKADISDEKADRFYDRLRVTMADFVEKRGPKLGRAKEYLLLVPDVFILLFRLLRDDRVSAQDKALLGTGLAYFIFPLDVMPEAIVGPMGFLDDLVFAAFILNKMLLDTDESILREHWSGEQDVLAMIRKVLRAADTLVNKKFVERVKKIVG